MSNGQQLQTFISTISITKVYKNPLSDPTKGFYYTIYGLDSAGNKAKLNCFNLKFIEGIFPDPSGKNVQFTYERRPSRADPNIPYFVIVGSEVQGVPMAQTQSQQTQQQLPGIALDKIPAGEPASMTDQPITEIPPEGSQSVQEPIVEGNKPWTQKELEIVRQACLKASAVFLGNIQKDATSRDVTAVADYFVDWVRNGSDDVKEAPKAGTTAKPYPEDKPAPFEEEAEKPIEKVDQNQKGEEVK